MAYAKGFYSNNCKVRVICLRPMEDPAQIFNTLISGTIDGINYEYSCSKTIRSKYFLVRRIDNLIGISRACIDILKEKKSEKTDAIIYYSISTSRAILLFVVTRFKKILFLKEESENPIIYYKIMSPIQRFLFKELHYLLFDGLLLMTKRLVRYFIDENKLKKPFLIVPMTVDISRFDKLDNRNKPVKYIAYCGTLNTNKDGVDVLIDAFSLLSSDFPDLNLYLIGGKASEEEYQSYLDKIALNKLGDKVFFTGRISKEAMPELLCGAHILVLPRPHSLQAEGGFPTKLGEYLATGNPVVVTRVGEITDYLTDQVNVFMAEPGSAESLKNRIIDILLDYDNAQEIGLKGKMAATKYFNYKIQAQSIIEFIRSLS
jgi:glycosyltransferase involved in cell wall biosynthesis